MVNELSGEQKKKIPLARQRLRTLWLLLVFLFGGLIVTNAIWLFPSLRDIEVNVSRLRLEIAGRAADSIQIFIDSHVKVLRDTAGRLRFGKGSAQDALNLLLKENSAFSTMSILDEGMKETLKVSRFQIVAKEDLQDFSMESALREAWSKQLYLGPVLRTRNLEPFMMVAVPLVFGESQEKGILMAELNLKHLSEAVSRFRFGISGKVYLVDKNTDRLVIDPDISLVLKNPNLQDRSIVKDLKVSDQVESAAYINERGVGVEASGLVIPGLEWSVIAEQNLQEINVLRNRILLLAAVSLGIGISLFLLLLLNTLKLVGLNRALQKSLEELNRSRLRLQEFLYENYLSAKMLIQRDRELVAANQELQTRNEELNEAGKLLVRRDLELTETNERLRALDAAKSEFVSVAAHQLRSPLTGIKWTIYSLWEQSFGKLNKRQKKLVQDALTATNRLITLINDLLDVARLEEGRFGFRFSRQEIMPIVQHMFERLKPAAAEKNIQFSLQVSQPKSIPPLELAPDKIVIVLENLFENAIKYTLPGGRVEVSVEKENDRVVVKVRDTGIGIPRDELKRVFSKFFRAQNAQLYQTSGTGLGLYLAKNIIEHHKGTMFFESNEQKGSIFGFWLPLPINKNS